MSKFLADQWSEIKKWWSVWVGLFATVALTAVPIIADQWPQLAPGFIALFPKGGEQWAPVIGLLLTIAARLVSQAAVLEAIGKLFRRKPKENGDDPA